MRPRIFSIPETVSVLFLFCFWGLSNGANILVLDPMASRSHHLWMRELNNALALIGHNVTSLSSYVEPGDARENVHYLHLEKVGPALYPENSDLMAMNQLTLREFFWAYIDYYKVNDEAARQSDGFQRLLDYPTDFKFDLIIMDIYATPGLYIFVDKFKDTPVMSASAYPVPGQVSRSDGVPYFFSYIPHELITSPVVTVWDRVVSFLMHVAVDLYEDFLVIPEIEKDLRKISPNMRPLKELMKSHRIHLVNYNSIVATAQPLMPNTIPVGGLQITEPKELPEDLRKVYEDPNSKGVVLFSLGTNLKAENLGRETLERLFEALGSFSEFNFIWKIDLKGIDLQLPKNVFVKNWLPQNDLLGQRKTRLFITHAGGLSTQEATWYGVPMLCVPGFFDQFPNCERSVQAGIAKKVDLTAVGEPVFRETLKELLERPSFLEKAREKGRLFRDQPEKPIERALWWVEYVLRNPEISHLKNPQFHEMNFLVKHSIDVYAILFVIVLVVVWGILKCACWRKKSVEDKLKMQ